jgi:phage-related protein
MFNFSSGRPVTNKPSNKYQYNCKTRQAIAIAKAQETQNIKKLQRRPLLDLNIEELDLLLNTV